MTGRKPGLKSTIWNKRENSASIQNKMKKQEFKNMRRLLQLLGQSETFHYLNYRDARRKTTARN